MIRTRTIIAVACLGFAVGGSAMAHAGQPGACDDVSRFKVDAGHMARAEIVVAAVVKDDVSDLSIKVVETLRGMHSDTWQIGYQGMPPHVPPMVRKGDRIIFGLDRMPQWPLGHARLVQYACNDNAVLPDTPQMRAAVQAAIEALQ